MIVPAHCDSRPGSQTVSLWYVAGWLGQRERSAAWLAGQIDLLIAHEGFPPPIPFYIGARRIASAHASARWLREPVDAWFDGLRPAHLIADGTEIAARYADRLDAAAAAIAEGIAA
ncbi:MAG TPA: hypothetical protein VGW34_09475 [Allosphingosinicella sp.]|nr:hypothetical protein [Allosphingosinicella sp.]